MHLKEAHKNNKGTIYSDLHFGGNTFLEAGRQLPDYICEKTQGCCPKAYRDSEDQKNK